MNTEIQELIKSNEDLQEQINQQAKLIESLSNPKKRWRAKLKRSYFYLDILGDIIESTEMNHYTDNNRYARGNYFKTTKEVYLYKNKQIFQQAIFDALREHEDDFVANFDNSQYNYFIGYNHRNKQFYVDRCVVKQDKPIESYSSIEACSWVIDNMQDELKLVWSME